MLLLGTPVVIVLNPKDEKRLSEIESVEPIAVKPGHITCTVPPDYEC